MDYKGWIANKDEINLNQLIDHLNPNVKSGAITTFTGIVRQVSDASDKQVKAMEVEAWEGKADESMNAIANKVGTTFNLLGVRIVHIQGILEIGDPIVYIVLSSIHRKEAFGALETAIQAYKEESPVWKKEIYEDGTSNWITTAKDKHSTD